MARRREVTRIEGFSDSVFAFAITLLVVSLEVPKTFAELVQTMRGFPAFAVCFLMLFQVWWRHYTFFRSYDLEDPFVIRSTGALLFVVLFYVYPLKFVWSMSFGSVEGRPVTAMIATSQIPLLFVVYGAGVIAVFGILALLYRYAYGQRDRLQLSATERIDARVRLWSNTAIAGWGVVSMLLALVLGRTAPHLIALAGYVYFGIGLSEWLLVRYRGRMCRRLNTASTSPA